MRIKVKKFKMNFKLALFTKKEEENEENLVPITFVIQ